MTTVCKFPFLIRLIPHVSTQVWTHLSSTLHIACLFVLVILLTVKHSKPTHYWDTVNVPNQHGRPRKKKEQRKKPPLPTHNTCQCWHKEQLQQNGKHLNVMPNFLFSHDVGRHHVIILTRLPMVQEMVHMVATLNETFPSLGKHAGSMSWHKSMFVCTQLMSSYTYTRMTAMLIQHKVGRRPNWWIHGNTSLKCQNTRHADWGHLLRNTKEAAPCARGGTNKWRQTPFAVKQGMTKEALQNHCMRT